MPTDSRPPASPQPVPVAGDRPASTAALRRARYGTLATFILAGAVGAVWMVRIPALTDKLHLDKGRVGTVVLCAGLGAMLAMQSTRGLLPRIGSHRALTVALPAGTAISSAIGLAPSYPWLLVASGAFGAAWGTVDVCMNAQASTIERLSRRHVMNGMHAGWSLGVVLGGGLGAFSAYLGMSFTRAVVAMALICLPATLAVTLTYLPDARRGDGARRSVRLPRAVYLIGLVTFASFLVEGSVADWSGLYLRDELRAAEAAAATGYPVFAAAMIIGRLVGDPVRRVLRDRTMLAASGLGIMAGFLVVVGTAAAWPALVGYFVVGLSVSTVVPLAFSIAGDLDPSGSGAAIAQAGAIGYAGMLLGPVVIGYLADATSLRTALILGLLLGAAVALLGGRVPAVQQPAVQPRRTRSADRR
jgi:MFS family permease